MRSFASDNNSGVHPLVMDAMFRANVDHAVGYGDDRWTDEALKCFATQFGEAAEVFFVFNGTGANSVALQAVTRPFNSIICASTAHILVDECGAPAKMTGATLTPIDTPDGKLTPELIKPYLKDFGVCHHPQPGAVYISQVSEMGTVYTIEEVRAIADLVHEYGMFLHMDGARLAGACEALGCSFRDVTVDAGVDILSFGGTKNGMMMGEAVVCFRPEISKNIKYIRKQSAQLASKMRYLSAGFIPYLKDELWRQNAEQANSHARKLFEAMSAYPEIHFTQKMQTNQIFFTLPRFVADRLLSEYFFYFWNEAISECRLVTSWDSTSEDVSKFIVILNTAISEYRNQCM